MLVSRRDMTDLDSPVSSRELSGVRDEVPDILSIGMGSVMIEEKRLIMNRLIECKDVLAQCVEDENRPENICSFAVRLSLSQIHVLSINMCYFVDFQ
jgi:hypothetical protein